MSLGELFNTVLLNFKFCIAQFFVGVTKGGGVGLGLGPRAQNAVLGVCNSIHISVVFCHLLQQSGQRTIGTLPPTKYGYTYLNFYTIRPPFTDQKRKIRKKSSLHKAQQVLAIYNIEIAQNKEYFADCLLTTIKWTREALYKSVKCYTGLFSL